MNYQLVETEKSTSNFIPCYFVPLYAEAEMVFDAAIRFKSYIESHSCLIFDCEKCVQAKANIELVLLLHVGVVVSGEQTVCPGKIGVVQK